MAVQDLQVADYRLSLTADQKPKEEITIHLSVEEKVVANRLVFSILRWYYMNNNIIKIWCDNDCLSWWFSNNLMQLKIQTGLPHSHKGQTI